MGNGFTIESGCSKPACQYVTLHSYTSVVSDCENPDASALTTWSSVAYVSDVCTESGSASNLWTCVDGTATQKYYLNSECAGNATLTLDYDISNEVSCGQTGGVVSATQSVSVACGTASFTGQTATSGAHELSHFVW